ncbi:MAG: hypothetical protein ACK4F9_02445 [Brevinematia bacterium]
MTEKDRIELIRKGNQLFNEGKIEEAAKIFLATDYKDGLVRVGDHYFYQEKRFFKAFLYYKKANYSKRLEEVYKKWAKVIHFLLEEDKEVQKLNNDQKDEKLQNPKIIPNEKSKEIKKYEFPNLDTR